MHGIGSVLWRVARSRGWLIAIAAVLALDFGSIPHVPWAKSGAKVAVFGEPSYRGTAHGRLLMGRPRMGESGLEWIWPWEEGYTSIAAEDSEWSNVSVFVDMQRRSGAYHLTEESLRLVVFPEDLIETRLSELHRVLLAELREDPEVAGSDYAASLLWVLERGGWSATRGIESGVRADRRAAGFGVLWCALATVHAAGWIVVAGVRRTRGAPS